MTCKRCEDIHTAQKEGKTQEPCKCDCHDNNGWLDTSGGATATTGTINLMGTDTSGIWNYAKTTADCTSTDINFTTSINIDEANTNKERKD